MADLTWGGREFYIAECPGCEASLAVETLGDRIEHRPDGGHDFIPDPERASADSGNAAGPVGSGEEARASDHASRTAGRQLGPEHQPSSPARQHLSADSGEAER